jgi:SAM-dependent methyltransferase
MTVGAELFDDDYLYFYADVLGDERSDADADVVKRLLSLRPGMRVLDVPCGEGRIAGRIAQAGCEVVGVDSSERLLELARERHPGAHFEQGDMRALRYRCEFDAAVNWFTSFGYFDRTDNDLVLKRFADSLRAGGRLLLELHNPARLDRILALTGGGAAALVERDGNLMVDRITFDPVTRRSHTERFMVRNGRVRRLAFSLEQVPPEELVQRLLGAGFARVQLFGGGGVPYDPDGPRLIALAQR